MEEKPQHPKSPLGGSTFLKYDFELIRCSGEYNYGKDAIGNLAHYMVDNTVIHTWPMSAGHFDIGSLDPYYEAYKKYGVGI